MKKIFTVAFALFLFIISFAEKTRVTTLDNPKDSTRYSRWMGFKRIDFKVAGRACLLVEPVQSAAGRPWIWRTEFFGHEPQGDSSLAAKGFYVVCMNLQDMYGAPVSLDLMDKFYDYLTGHKGLNSKTVLEGFSRGGLFAFNWAARHPDRINCLYVDAPVCDFKSWPGGKGKSPGSPEDWEKLKKIYGRSRDRRCPREDQETKSRLACWERWTQSKIDLPGC